MAIRINRWILCSCISAFFSFLKSILFRSKSTKQKLNLPMTKRQGPDGQESATEEELQNWESWTDDGGGFTGVTVDSAQQGPQGDLMSEEEDFFAGMTPSFKKAALIRKKGSKTTKHYSSGSGNRLSLGVDDTATLSGELGAWTESSGGWEEEALDEDLELEADSVLKEKREAERRKRLVEQQRKKAEREAQRASQRGSSKLAVKLS